MLKEDPPLHNLLARLRDEAHRFAISYYRRRHRQATLQSRLDDIGGIGPKRRRELLRHFGSIRRVGTASIGELRQVPGINRPLAEKIYLTFHETAGDNSGY